MSTGIIEQLASKALIKSTVNGSTDLVYRPEGYSACISQDFVRKYTELLLIEVLAFTFVKDDEYDAFDLYEHFGLKLKWVLKTAITLMILIEGTTETKMVVRYHKNNVYALHMNLVNVAVTVLAISDYEYDEEYYWPLHLIRYS